MRVNNFKENFNAEIENINNVLKEIEKLAGLKSEKMDNVKIAAAGTFLHNFYNGIENIIKRALIVEGVKIKNSFNWHKETLLKAKALDIITEKTHINLIQFLSFRHYFIHGYSFKIMPDELLLLLKQTDEVFNEFKKEIEKHFNI